MPSNKKSRHRRRRHNNGVIDIMRTLPTELDEGRRKLIEDIGIELESCLVLEKFWEVKTEVKKASDVALKDMHCHRFKDSCNYKEIMDTRVNLERSYDQIVTECRIINGINISEWKQDKETGSVIWTAVFELTNIGLRHIIPKSKILKYIFLKHKNTETHKPQKQKARKNFWGCLSD